MKIDRRIAEIKEATKVGQEVSRLQHLYTLSWRRKATAFATWSSRRGWGAGVSSPGTWAVVSDIAAKSLSYFLGEQSIPKKGLKSGG